MGDPSRGLGPICLLPDSLTLPPNTEHPVWSVRSPSLPFAAGLQLGTGEHLWDARRTCVCLLAGAPGHPACLLTCRLCSIQVWVQLLAFKHLEITAP